jgi:hypothetical protein
MNKIKIGISPEVEMINIILYNSKYNDICRELIGFSPMVEIENDYTKEIQRYFDSFYSHKVYRKVESMVKKGFFLSRPMEFALSIDSLNNFKSRYKLSKFAIDMSGGQKIIDELTDLLRDFEKVTDFNKFIPKINHYYKESLLRVNNLCEKYLFVEVIENFYGKSSNNCHFIISNLNKGNFGIHFKNENNNIDMYSVFTMYGTSEDEVNHELNRGALSCNTIFHEFSHPIINPLTEKNKELVNKYKIVYEYLRPYKRPLTGYVDWEECVNEHIIRACSIFLVRKTCGDYYADRHLEHDYNLGYRYIPNLIEKLEYYENNRDTYKTIDSFYKELIKSFSEKI